MGETVCRQIPVKLNTDQQRISMFVGVGETVCRQIPVKLNTDQQRISMFVGAGVALGDVSKAYVDAQDNALRQQIIQINNDILLQIGTETTERINNDNSILELLSELDSKKINDVLLDGESIVIAGQIANIPLATAEKAGAMSSTDKERLDLIATTSFLTWINGAYEFVSTPENFSVDNFPTVQAGFLDSNPVDNPTISIDDETYEIYIAGVAPKAGEIFTNDTCFIAFKTGRADLFAVDAHKAYVISNTPSNALLATEQAVKNYVDGKAGGGNVDDVRLNNVSIVTDKIANIPLAVTISSNPTDTALATERAVKSYIDNIQFVTAAQGRAAWYYTSNTTLSDVRPTANITIPFALSGTTATSRAFAGIFPAGGFFIPSASYVKTLYLTGLQGEVTYTITFNYQIKGITVWTYSQTLTTANNQTSAVLTVNVPSESTYNTRINWTTGDSYSETITVAKNTTGNNHSVNIVQVPTSGRYSFMQRNGGVVYSSDIFDVVLNRAQSDINSGETTKDLGSVAGLIELDYKVSKVFKCTVLDISTIVLKNMPANMTNTVVLELKNGGQYFISHPNGCQFSGGIAPSLTANGKDLLFYMFDGTNVFCNVLKDVK